MYDSPDDVGIMCQYLYGMKFNAIVFHNILIEQVVMPTFVHTVLSFF